MFKLFTFIKKNSERIPSKNFKKLGNKKLYQNYIDKFLDNFDIYIDTDSDEILNYCKKLKNCLAYKRLKKHIEAKNPANEMTKRFINDYCDPDEIIILSHVTNPFLKTETIKKYINKFTLQGEFDSYISTTNIYEMGLLYDTMGSSIRGINFEWGALELTKTQELHPIKILNHAFYIGRAKTFYEFGRFTKNPRFIPLNFPENLDIDNTIDLKLANVIRENEDAFK